MRDYVFRRRPLRSFFGHLLLATQKKVTSCRATPGKAKSVIKKSECLLMELSREYECWGSPAHPSLPCLFSQC